LATIKIVESQAGQAGKDLDALKGVTIPLKIGGTFSEPTFNIDLEPILKARAQAELDKVKAEAKTRLDTEKAETKQQAEQKEEELKQELEQKREEVKDKLRDKFKKLF
jgi:AsmA protein